MSYKYRLSKSYYPEDDDSIILECDKLYSFKEFEELVFKLMYPEEDDEDYVDEYTMRSIHAIAERLVYDYDFSYVKVDVDFTI